MSFCNGAIFSVLSGRIGFASLRAFGVYVMTKIVFLDAATLAEGVALRRPGFPHEWVNYPSTPAELTVLRAQDADVVVTNKVRFDAATIGALPRLKLIAVAATGYDHVDLAAARAGKVGVTNIKGYSADSVPEHVFALILALKRQILPYVSDIRAGQWQKNGLFAFHDHRITELRGKRLGLIGSGSLGSRVAELGRAFGMDVVFSARKGAAPSEGKGAAPSEGKGAAPSEGKISFAELLASSDVISLHCPLNSETENLLSDAEFAQMTRAPIVINTARGGMIDEAALLRALDAGKVSGAGIDVTRPEPPPADSAIMALAQRQNVLVTPHIGWASLEAQQTLADQLGDVLESFAAGGRMNRLD